MFVGQLKIINSLEHCQSEIID